MSELKMGDIAPEFKSDSTSGELSLDKFKDQNIVLYFYPKDMTPGCTIQAKEFSALYSEFKKLNTEIIGVSKNSLSTHHRFCEKENIPHPVLVDTEGAICKLYGVFKRSLCLAKHFLVLIEVPF